MHYTAGRGEPRSVARLFANPRVERSAHIIVGRGVDSVLPQVVQCVDLDDAAFHAGDGGRSRFPRAAQLDACEFVPLAAVPPMPREVNCRSVGIEVCNRGWAPRGPNPYVEARHPNPASSSTSWESFNDEQLDEIEGVVSTLLLLRPTLRYVTAHEDVTNQHTLGEPGAKVDIGPAFPWDRMPSKLTRVRFDYERIGWTRAA